MFSEELKEALNKDVVGQPQAVNSIVRGVSRLVSGLMPLERSWCAYLFMGPPGTGRAHAVRVLSRILHGDESVFSVSCNSGLLADPWTWFVQQLAPLFDSRGKPSHATPGHSPSVILIQDLECAGKEFFPMLARVLESGDIALPGGRRGRFDDCLIFLCTSLCTDQILENARIGFSVSPGEGDDDDGHDAMYKSCMSEAEETFGLDLLTQLDEVIVFRRLETEHLTMALERHFDRVRRWLARSGVEVSMRPAAEDFLLQQGSHRTMLGARELIHVHAQEVEFPLADLVMSGQLGPGRSAVIDHLPGKGHLHFTIETRQEEGTAPALSADVLTVPVS